MDRQGITVRAKLLVPEWCRRGMKCIAQNSLESSSTSRDLLAVHEAESEATVNSEKSQEEGGSAVQVEAAVRGGEGVLGMLQGGCSTSPAVLRKSRERFMTPTIDG